MDNNEAGNECGAAAGSDNQKDRPVQWHEGFMCALELEFKDNWDNMQFIRNHTLNTKPLEIDMLIIELEKGIDIKDEIGGFFRTYNIVEYKSDIVGNELDVGRHKILDIISDKASKQAIRDAFIYKESVTDKRELDLYDSVLDLCMRLNEKPIEELKEEDQKMNQALMRIMEPELREATQRVERETAQRVERETAQRVERETKAADMKLLVKNMRRFHAGDDDILETLKEDYGLPEEEALSYL